MFVCLSLNVSKFSFVCIHLWKSEEDLGVCSILGPVGWGMAPTQVVRLPVKPLPIELSHQPMVIFKSFFGVRNMEA